MSAERLTYLDSSAIVKLAVLEPESGALRARLRRRHGLVSSRLATAEVVRALWPLGEAAVRRGHQALDQIDLLRVNDRILDDAAGLPPQELRTLDAIHLATAQLLGGELRLLITYDERMADAARQLGLSVAAPS